MALGRSLSAPNLFRNLRMLSLYGCDLDDEAAKSLCECFATADSQIEDLEYVLA